MKKIFSLLFLFCQFGAFAQSPFLIEEEFDGGTTPPAGWVFSSGISTFTSGLSCGKSIPSLRFSATGDQVTTGTWSGGDQITFLFKSSGGTNSTDNLLVEVFDGSVWTTLASVAPHTTATIVTRSISTSVVQARFTYTKGITNIALDDFTVRKAGTCTGNGMHLTFLNVDACGAACEGKDEFFIVMTGADSMNVADFEFSYPDANLSTLTVCGASANAPCDMYLATNPAEVTVLNTLAGCNIFTTPTGLIPPNSRVMIFNGNPQNTRTNFSSLCSSGNTYYTLFVSNTTDCAGRFGNFGLSADPIRNFFLRDRGTGCTDTISYSRDNIGLSDSSGHAVDGASISYSASGAQFIHTNCSNFSVLPVAIFTSSDTAFCNEGGKCIDFFDNSMGNPTSWKWNFPGAIPDTSTAQNPTGICYFSTGTYAVSLIVTSVNGTDTVVVSPMITFGQAPVPPTLHLSGDTITCGQFYAYQWYFNGVPITGATNSFYVATWNGSYNVMVTDSLGCSSLSNGITYVAIQELSGHDLYGRLDVFPNPAKDHITINGLPSAVRVAIDLYNVLGEKVYSKHLKTSIEKPQINIDISDFSHGIYFIQLIVLEKTFYAKFLKD